MAAAARPRGSQTVDQATLSGPVTGGEHGFPATSTPLDLAAYGYVEQEYFLSGTATAYQQQGTWGSNGRWSVTPASTASYKTRILVRRPIHQKDFNGTVVVEWLNDSGDVDVDPDFGYLHEELLRGYAWVGVSAQAIGINDTTPGTLGPGAVGLKAWDPTRYGSLHHPGDSYSYDIFSQAGAALRHPHGANPLAGLRVKDLIADGESQSAFRMLTYVNAIEPVANVYSGFLIHSRDGTGAPLTGTGIEGQVPAPARVRTDLKVPVFQLETETDMYTLSNGPGPDSFPAARQPDTRRIRTWEVAGTAHIDAYYIAYLNEEGLKQYGASGFNNLSAAIGIANDGPEHYVACAALRALRNWIVHETPPPHANPLTTADGAIVRDAHGNALGGVRTPQMDVPIATLTGEGASLIGRTVPFDAATLKDLYPTHQAYVTAFTRAAQRTLRAGFITPEGARQMIADAARSDIGR